MKLNKPIIISAFLVIALAVIIALQKSPPEKADDARAAYAPRLPAARSASASNSTRNDGTASQPVRQDQDQNAQSEATVKAREATLEIIHEASVTYDPAELPVIEPYLLSPDPEIRAAAVNAMVILGDASASSLLREAATKISSTKEALKMLEAAAYVELPPLDIKNFSALAKKRKHEKQQAEQEKAAREKSEQEAAETPE